MQEQVDEATVATMQAIAIQKPPPRATESRVWISAFRDKEKARYLVRCGPFRSPAVCYRPLYWWTWGESNRTGASL